MGYGSLALFGSTVRGKPHADSDVDVLVDLVEDHGLTLVDWIRLQDYLRDVLGLPVDLTSRTTVRPLLRDAIFSEAVDVF